MTPLEATQVVIMLLATFPSAKIEPAATDSKGKAVPNTGTAATYARLLADLDPVIAAAAIDRVAGTHRYPTILPAVAEIREAALALTAGDRRPGGEAWGDVQRLLRAGFSSYKAPTSADVGDPLVFAAIQDLGWRAICMADEDDPSPRARFIDLYDELAVAARREMLTRTLPAVANLRQLRATEEEQHARLVAARDASERRRLAAASEPRPIAAVIDLARAARGVR